MRKELVIAVMGLTFAVLLPAAASPRSQAPTACDGRFVGGVSIDGLKVTITAGATGPAGNYIDHVYDWGDGSSVSTLRVVAIGIDATARGSVEHTYALAGTYTISSTATTSSGTFVDCGQPTVTGTRTVTVPPPAGTLVGGLAPGFAPGQIKPPGSSSFAAITPGSTIPPGTVVDVSQGRWISLSDSRGRQAIFYGQTDSVPSRFVYAGVTAGFAELRLTGGDFSVCKKRTILSASAEKPVRRLWGKGKGTFRTRGRYASAAVRGTWWLTADYCSRTLVRVREGVMTVRDIPGKKTIVVRAPGSYSAQP